MHTNSWVEKDEEKKCFHKINQTKQPYRELLICGAKKYKANGFLAMNVDWWNFNYIWVGQFGRCEMFDLQNKTALKCHINHPLLPQSYCTIIASQSITPAPGEAPGVQCKRLRHGQDGQGKATLQALLVKSVRFIHYKSGNTKHFQVIIHII